MTPTAGEGGKGPSTNGKSEEAQALKDDFEIQQYIQALSASSSRVRFVMLAIIVVAVASVATLWSERDGSWERSRLTALSHKAVVADACGNIHRKFQIRGDLSS